MKTVILFLLAFVPFSAYPQIMEGPYFNELRGMEDKNGNTHLFYRLYSLNDQGEYYYFCNNDFWHFDIKAKVDTLFLPTYQSTQAHITGFYGTADFKFWNSDPAAFISCGDAGGIDGSGFVKRFDMDHGKYLLFGRPIERVFISPKNDSLIIASAYINFISRDGGWKWDTLKTMSVNDAILGISPNNDSTLFFIRGKYLQKTNNLGLQSIIIDSTITSFKKQIIFDADKKHFYFLGINEFGKNALFVSDNEGEPGSLRECFSSDYNIMLSVDNSKAGNIYVTDGFKVSYSDFYGLGFVKTKSIGKKIVGIYKKPNSNKLYLAQRYQLLEMVNDSVTIIKKLPVPSHLLNLYPLAVGNKWIYDTFYEDYTVKKYPGTNVRAVIKDTIMDNGKKYFVIHEEKTGRYFSFGDSYERVDSAAGKIYRYDFYKPPEKEVVAEDLTAEGGETLVTFNYMTPWLSTGYSCKSFANTIFGKHCTGSSFSVFVNGIGGLNYSLASELGITEYDCSRELGLRYYGKLRGVIINGLIFGDTTLTDVKYSTNKVPASFNLYQNYPNPFNPTSVIKYSLPKEERVSLCIYNILGQKVKALVDEIKTAGVHEVVFNSTGLPSGVYFYKITTDNYTNSRKLIILK